MSITLGPSSLLDGVVLSYDMMNREKSWIGPPIVNASLIDGQSGVSPWGGDSSPVDLGIDPNVRFRSKAVAKFQTGANGNCYLNSATDLATTTTSTAWTFTVYLKRVDGKPVPATIGMYMYVTGNTNGVLSVPTVEVEDGWYKAVYTRTDMTAGYPTLVGMYSLGVSTQYYFAEWQCENTVSSTKYVKSSRSTTESLLDLTRTTPITTSSLTYELDGSFSFNALGNYIALPNDIGYTDSFSTVAWIKTAGAGRGGYHVVTGPATFELSIPSASGAIRAGVTTSTGRIVTDAGSGLTDGNWHMVSATVSPTMKTTYIDGVLIGTQALTGTLTGVSSRAIGKFGQGDGVYGFNGSISALSVYNRELSSAEVQTIFQSSRARYGV